jgi:type IV fimbrial biogenesis protein FimT
VFWQLQVLISLLHFVLDGTVDCSNEQNSNSNTYIIRVGDKKPRQFFIMSFPFVCKKIPFIRHSGTKMIPYFRINMPFVRNARFIAGYTLIEILAVLIIAGVLAALAVPSLKSFTADSRLSSQTNETIADLQFARSEAIRRAMTIIVCKSANPTASSPACDTTAANPWSSGRLIYVDTNNNSTLDAGELIRVRTSLEGTNNKLLGDGTTTGTGNGIGFSANGFRCDLPASLPGACTVNSAGSEKQMILCDQRGVTQARAIVVGVSGRVRLANKGTDMDNANITTATWACPTL